jgi:hypothetical protein
METFSGIGLMNDAKKRDTWIYMFEDTFKSHKSYDVIVRVGGEYSLAFNNYDQALQFANRITLNESSNGRIIVEGVNVTISLDIEVGKRGFRIDCGENKELAERLVKELRKQYIELKNDTNSFYQELAVR